MAFKHGVYVQELDTPILGVRTVDSALPFVVGTAPPGAPVNKAELVFNYTDAAEKFKLNDDPTYTLNQAAKIFFQLYYRASFTRWIGNARHYYVEQIFTCRYVAFRIFYCCVKTQFFVYSPIYLVYTDNNSFLFPQIL